MGQQLAVRFEVAHEVQRHLAAPGAHEGDLLGQNRLAAAGRANDHDDRAAQQAATEQCVQVGHAGVEALRQVIGPRL